MESAPWLLCIYFPCLGLWIIRATSRHTDWLPKSGPSSSFWFEAEKPLQFSDRQPDIACGRVWATQNDWPENLKVTYTVERQDTAGREVSRSRLHLLLRLGPAIVSVVWFMPYNFLLSALTSCNSVSITHKQKNSGDCRNWAQVHLNSKTTCFSMPKEGDRQRRNTFILIYQSSDWCILGSPKRWPR